MGNNKSQQEKKQISWNIKYNITNEIKWIEKSELTHDEDDQICFIVMYTQLTL